MIVRLGKAVGVESDVTECGEVAVQWLLDGKTPRRSWCSNRIVSLFIALVLLLACHVELAHAQITEMIPAAPERYHVDEHGIDVIRGSYAHSTTDVSVGSSPQNGLFYQRVASIRSGNVMVPTIGGTPTCLLLIDCVSGSIGVGIEGKSDTFAPDTSYTFPNPLPSSYHTLLGDGATLAITPWQSSYGNDVGSALTYTASDGLIAHGYTSSMTGGDLRGIVTDVVRPDGFTTTFTYDIIPVCQAGTLRITNGNSSCSGNLAGYAHRLRKVSNSANYTAYFKADTNDQAIDAGADFSSLLWVSAVTMVNTANDTCDSITSCTPSPVRPTSIYGGWKVTDTVVDPLGRSTSGLVGNWTDYCGSDFVDYYNVGYDTHLAVKHDGAAAPQTVVCYFGDEGGYLNPIASAVGMVKSITIGNDKFTYSYVDAPDNGSPGQFNPQGMTDIRRTTTVDGPNGYHRVYWGSWSKGLVYTVTDELGRVTSYTYDSAKRVTARRNPEGDIWTYTYDTRGNVTEARHIAKTPGTPADIVTGATYPATCAYRASCNKPISVTDPRGGITNYEYDNTTGQITRILQPADVRGIRPETRMTYTSVNGVSMLSATAICQNGAGCFGTSDEVRTEYAYNGNLLVTSETHKLGDGTVLATITSSYDSVGNRILVDGPLPGSADTTQYRYDAARQLVGEIRPATTSPAGTSNLAHRLSYTSFGKIALDETGSVQGQSDSAWQNFAPASARRTTYGGDERPAAAFLQDASGTALSATQYSYDTNGRLLCETVRMNRAIFAALPSDACTLGNPGSDGPDRMTRNVYDAAGQLIQVRKAVGTSLEQAYATYAYSANGKQTDVVDANGNRATYTYDGFDRLVQWNFPSTLAPTSFNGATQATALSSAGSANSGDYEAYAYDANGNRTSFRKRDGSVLGYTYDALNRVTVKAVPSRSGLGSIHTRSVYYSYDLQGHQLTAQFDSSSGEGVINTFDGLGRQLTSAITMDGVTRTVSYQYDANGNRTRVTYPDNNFVTYNYDGLDRPSSILRSGSVTVASYAYNADGTRASFNGGVSTSYGYDTIGRLTSLTNAPGGNASYTNSYGFDYNPASQITSLTKSNDSFSFTGFYNVNRNYTTNGLNQYTTAGSASFTYDANGNLTADGMTTFLYDIENRLVNAGGAKNAQLRYDPLGRLYEISSSTGTTRFLYDGDALIGEYDGAGNLLRRYVHGADLKADDPVAWYEGSSFDGASERILRGDWQGSIALVTDNSGSNIYAVNTYDDYGIPGANNAGRFQYTGQAWTSELGMYYYKARFYSPTLGRFMQTDPIGYKDQINLYAYVGDDPVDKTDFSGNCIEDACIAEGAAVAACVGGGCEAAGTAIVGGAEVAGGMISGLAARAGSFFLTQAHNLTVAAGEVAEAIAPGAGGGLVAKGTIQAYESGPANELKAGSKVGDGLDIHHAPQAHVATQVSPGYSRTNGPAIALPAAEHRAIPRVSGQVGGQSVRSMVAGEVRNLRNFTNASNSQIQSWLKNAKEYFGL